MQLLAVSILQILPMQRFPARTSILLNGNVISHLSKLPNHLRTWKVGVSDWDNGRSLLVESVTGKQLVVMGNFTHNAVDVAFPATAGNWTNYFTGKSETINTQVNVPAHGYVVYTNF